MTYILEFILQVLPLTDRSAIHIRPICILLMDFLPTPLAYRKQLLCVLQQCFDVLLLVVSSASAMTTMGGLSLSSMSVPELSPEVSACFRFALPLISDGWTDVLQDFGWRDPATLSTGE